jgi:hypothetical protein
MRGRTAGNEERRKRRRAKSGRRDCARSGGARAATQADTRSRKRESKKPAVLMTQSRGTGMKRGRESDCEIQQTKKDTNGRSWTAAEAAEAPSSLFRSSDAAERKVSSCDGLRAGSGVEAGSE